MPHPASQRNKTDPPPGQARVAITSQRPRARPGTTAPPSRRPPARPGDAPDAAQPARMHQKAVRRIMRPPTATRSDGAFRHRMQPTADIPAHGRGPPRLDTGRAPGPHAAPQAARVHANRRMMHQMQFRSLETGWPRCAGTSAGQSRYPSACAAAAPGHRPPGNQPTRGVVSPSHCPAGPAQNRMIGVRTPSLKEPAPGQSRQPAGRPGSTSLSVISPAPGLRADPRSLTAI